MLGSNGKTAHVAQVLEEGVLLDNGEMLITGIGYMPSEAEVTDSSAISDDEKQGLLNELFPPQDDASTDDGNGDENSDDSGDGE